LLHVLLETDTLLQDQPTRLWQRVQ
jgi:hypothetical protein